ncbi:hypothetical protein AAG906_017368 [Vitis piasezkii]
MAGFLKALCYSQVLVFLLSITCSAAKEFLVGGKTNAWKIPSSQSDSLNKWAESSRFLVGDSLVWTYDKEKDSVLKVRREAYISCNTSDAIEEYNGGNTKVSLDKSGPHYFISGAEGHCEKGQKVIVVVLSQRHRLVGVSPAPSPSEVEGPAVAPTSDASSFKAGYLVALGVLVGFVWM